MACRPFDIKPLPITMMTYWKDTTVFYQENAFENGVCEMVAIFVSTSVC